MTEFRIAMSTVNIYADVTDAPKLHYPGGALLPDVVNVLYRLDNGAERWKGVVKVSGLRYLASGDVGRTRVSPTFDHDDKRLPQWLADFVSANPPARLAETR